MRLLALLPLATSCVFTFVTDHDTVPVDDAFTSVVVHNQTGALAVARGASASLEFVSRYHRTPPLVDWYVEGETLHIDGSCPQARFVCSVDIVVTAPNDVDVTAVLDTGDVQFRDLTGAFSVDVLTGSIGMHQIGGDADVATSTGSIVGTDLELGSLRGRTFTGSVDAVYLSLPDLVDVETQTGSIDLLVPAARYDVETSTVVGSVEIVGITTDATASRAIRAHTQTGSVRVVGYTPPPHEYLPACEAADGDAYDQTSASLDGDALVVDLSYSGGCATHDFTLCWPDQSFMESEPVQARLELLHDDHDDACDSVVLDTHTFDLSPLRQAWMDAYQASSGTIVIHMGTSELTYTF